MHRPPREAPSAGTPPTLWTAQAKTVARAEALRRRRARPPADLAAQSERTVAALLAWPPLLSAGTVAAYASLDDEPATEALRTALRARRCRVLLPCLDADDDLDWAPDTGAPLRRGLRGTDEPPPPRLGREAVSAADVVVVPAVAVARDGTRLGRGGGSYDRALQRVRPGTPVVALLFDGDLLEAMPRAAHDVPVTHAATPSGIVALGGGPSAVP